MGSNMLGFNILNNSITQINTGSNASLASASNTNDVINHLGLETNIYDFKPDTFITSNKLNPEELQAKSDSSFLNGLNSSKALTYKGMVRLHSIDQTKLSKKDQDTYEKLLQESNNEINKQIKDYQKYKKNFELKNRNIKKDLEKQMKGLNPVSDEYKAIQEEIIITDAVLNRSTKMKTSISTENFLEDINNDPSVLEYFQQTMNGEESPDREAYEVLIAINTADQEVAESYLDIVNNTESGQAFIKEELDAANIEEAKQKVNKRISQLSKSFKTSMKKANEGVKKRVSNLKKIRKKLHLRRASSTESNKTLSQANKDNEEINQKNKVLANSDQRTPTELKGKLKTKNASSKKIAEKLVRIQGVQVAASHSIYGSEVRELLSETRYQSHSKAHSSFTKQQQQATSLGQVV